MSGEGNILEAKLSSAGQAIGLILQFTLPFFALDHLCVKMIVENICFFNVYKNNILKKVDINYRRLKLQNNF